MELETWIRARLTLASVEVSLFSSLSHVSGSFTLSVTFSRSVRVRRPGAWREASGMRRYTRDEQVHPVTSRCTL